MVEEFVIMSRVHDALRMAGFSPDQLTEPRDSPVTPEPVAQRVVVPPVPQPAVEVPKTEPVPDLIPESPVQPTKPQPSIQKDAVWRQVGKDVPVKITHRTDGRVITRLKIGEWWRRTFISRYIDNRPPRIREIDSRINDWNFPEQEEFSLQRGKRYLIRFFTNTVIQKNKDGTSKTVIIKVTKEQCLAKASADGALPVTCPEFFVVWSQSWKYWPKNMKLVLFREEAAWTEKLLVKKRDEDGMPITSEVSTRWVPNCIVTDFDTLDPKLSVFGLTNLAGEFAEGTFGILYMVCVYEVSDEMVDEVK